MADIAAVQKNIKNKKAQLDKKLKSIENLTGDKSVKGLKKSLKRMQRKLRLIHIKEKRLTKKTVKEDKR